MKFSKILCACLAAVLLFAFVAGSTACTNEPAKPKKTSGSNKT